MEFFDKLLDITRWLCHRRNQPVRHILSEEMTPEAVNQQGPEFFNRVRQGKLEPVRCGERGFCSLHGVELFQLGKSVPVSQQAVAENLLLCHAKFQRRHVSQAGTGEELPYMMKVVFVGYEHVLQENLPTQFDVPYTLDHVEYCVNIERQEFEIIFSKASRFTPKGQKPDTTIPAVESGQSIIVPKQPIGELISA